MADQGLKHLEKLPLTHLGLAQTQISDAGLISLATMPLEYLNLYGAPVTPRGLEVLRKLKSLNQLTIAIPEENRDEVEHLGSVLGMTITEGIRKEWDGRTVIAYHLKR